MATSVNPVFLSGGIHLKERQLAKIPSLAVQRKSNQGSTRRNISIRAEKNVSKGGGGGDFITGFLMGGALFGTLAYIYAPQLRRAILNEDEHGFRKPRKLVYYDEGLERTRLINEKIKQLNTAIDKVTSKFMGNKKYPPIPPGFEQEDYSEFTV